MTHKKLEVEMNDLAMPEIHVVQDRENSEAQEPQKAQETSKKPEKKRSICFDTLAVPEIHIK